MANHDLEARTVPDLCEHPEFASSVDVTRLSEVEDGPITGYTADIVVRCARCNEPFDFIGLPVGSSPVQPMVSFDGIEARMPLRPHFGDAAPASPALPEPPRQWGYDRTLHMFVGTPGVNGEVQTRVALESFEDVKVADLYASWGLTRAVALALLAPAPALPVEGDDSDRIEAARVKRWTYVHAATDNPTEDGIWKAINDRIGWGYSGVSGARESECNQDIRDAIAAIRADERRASEERERVLRAALEDVIREWDNNDRLFSAAYRMTEVARRALLIPENAASSEGEGQ